jgi:ElaA protein
LQACLRVVDPGVNYPEPSIGRVVTAREARGGGVGRALMEQGLARCHQVWPGRAVRISAQAHLQRFYGSLGFVAVSEVYLEDDIPHIEMLWSPR